MSQPYNPIELRDQEYIQFFDYPSWKNVKKRIVYVWKEIGNCWIWE
jgi:hypothetical protein